MFQWFFAINKRNNVLIEQRIENEMFVIAERPNNIFIIEPVFHMVNAG